MHESAMNESYHPPISPLAIVSAIAAAFTPLAFLSPVFAVPALVAIPAGVFAMISHRRYGHLGKLLAKYGIIVSSICATIGPIFDHYWHEYVYNSEAPPGYIRLDFSKLASDDDDGLGQYVGRKVCLKGFNVDFNSRVPKSTIRFSHNGSRYHRDKAMVVELRSSVVENSLYEPIAVSGILQPNPDYDGTKESSRYKLVDAEIRWSQTYRQLGARSSEGFCFRSPVPPFDRHDVVDRKRSQFVQPFLCGRIDFPA